MTPLEFGLMFMLGLVSSLHCVQMCGPIVLSYSVALESLTSPTGKIFPRLLNNHLAYNFGRILTYSALGAAAGAAGESMSLLARISGWTHVVAIVSGISMIVVGIAMLGVLPPSLVGNRFLQVPSSFLRRSGKLIAAPGSGKRFALGVTLGLLPCGLVYAALLKAMATGSPAFGAASMFAFGLGTSGSLLALGMFSSAIRLRMNRFGRQFAALGVVVMGSLLVWRGTMPVMMMEHHMHAHH